jgi:anti-anti-sigma regulatory factor
MRQLSPGMAVLTVHCTVTYGTATIAVRGRVAASRCHVLRDTLEIARVIGCGPIVVDLTNAEHIAAAAAVVIRQAAANARRDHRVFTVRNLRANAVMNRRAARILHGLTVGADGRRPTTAASTLPP